MLPRVQTPTAPETSDADNGLGGGPADALVRWIKRVGLVGGPLAAAAIFWAQPAGLSPAGCAVVAVAAWMALWWLTEAVPLAATALLPLVLFPVLHVQPLSLTARSYADEVIFLFAGGFLMGLALEASGLHRRLALFAVLIVGTSPRRLLAGLMLATGGISLFVSNTATTLMMLPIGLSLVTVLEAIRREHPGGRDEWDPRSARNFAARTLLGVAYAATLGGMGTPIGTPPNAVMRGAVQTTLGVEIGFWQWVIVAAPIQLLLFPAGWLILVVLFPVRAAGIEGGRAHLRDELARLGRLSREEWFTAVVFTIAVAGWIFRDAIASALGLHMQQGERSVRLLTDAGIAVAAGVVLLCVPVRRASAARPATVLSWDHAQRLPWGVLVLFGGGLAMAAAMTATGVDDALAAQFKSLGGLPLGLVLLVVVAVIVLTGELAGNVAAATAMMPILLAAAGPMGVDPVLLVFAATFAVSCGFMLPVATPPNAIVFATGRIGLQRMLRAGLALDLAGIAVITGVMWALGPTLLQWAGIAR